MTLLGFQANMEGQHSKVWDGLHVSPRLAPSKGAKLCNLLHKTPSPLADIEVWCLDLIDWWARSPQRHRAAFICYLSMHPSTPEYNRIFSQLPEWVRVAVPPDTSLQRAWDAWHGCQSLLQHLPKAERSSRCSHSYLLDIQLHLYL